MRSNEQQLNRSTIDYKHTFCVKIVYTTFALFFFPILLVDLILFIIKFFSQVLMLSLSSTLNAFCLWKQARNQTTHRR